VSDILGWFTNFTPRHTKRYAELAKCAAEAIAGYADDVRRGAFPTEAQSFSIDEEVLRRVEDAFPGER